MHPLSLSLCELSHLPSPEFVRISPFLGTFSCVFVIDDLHIGMVIHSEVLVLHEAALPTIIKVKSLP